MWRLFPGWLVLCGCPFEHGGLVLRPHPSEVAASCGTAAATPTCVAEARAARRSAR